MLSMPSRTFPDGTRPPFDGDNNVIDCRCTVVVSCAELLDIFVPSEIGFNRVIGVGSRSICH